MTLVKQLHDENARELNADATVVARHAALHGLWPGPSRSHHQNDGVAARTCRSLARNSMARDGARDWPWLQWIRIPWPAWRYQLAANERKCRNESTRNSGVGGSMRFR